MTYLVFERLLLGLDYVAFWLIRQCHQKFDTLGLTRDNLTNYHLTSNAKYIPRLRITHIAFAWLNGEIDLILANFKSDAHRFMLLFSINLAPCRCRKVTIHSFIHFLLRHSEQILTLAISMHTV